MIYALWKNCIRTLLVLPIAALLADATYATTLPDPTIDTSIAKENVMQSIVLAGGCFWGMQMIFKHVRGVTSVTAGYSGGAEDTANYKTVSSGTTGHAEAVEITYEPSQISLGQLLKIYFSVAHDPTQLNRQGPDEGKQYRSAVFYLNDEQMRVVNAYIAQLQSVKAFPQRIVTQVVPLKGFYAAEAFHQNYAEHHLSDPYIVINDLPKFANLQRQYPVFFIP